MELIGAQGLAKIADEGLAFALLVVIIAGLVWDRIRILSELREQRAAFITALEKYADVVERNSNAFTTLSLKIDGLRKDN